MEKDHLLNVGRYNQKINQILNISIPELDIYRSEGLLVHMRKRKHFKCLKYLDCIPDIIANPDYVGVNPNEEGKTIELIKRYEDAVLLGIKLDIDGGYLYVSTMYDLQEAKIARRLYSGRIKKFNVDKELEE